MAALSLLFASADDEEADSSTVMAVASFHHDPKVDDDDTDDCCEAPASVSTHYADLNLAHLSLNAVPAHYLTPSSAYHPSLVKSLSLHHNEIIQLPREMSGFNKLVALDLSSNCLAEVSESLCRLPRLRVLLLKSNQLDMDSFPKAFNQLTTLEVLNLSGNRLEELPPQILELRGLKALYVGGNRLRSLPNGIFELSALELLYLGGNQLREIPATIGKLLLLTSLVLCDNRLETIPSTVAHLQRLESLSLHNNVLRTLPTEIVKLQNLHQLSLRSNPLVARFVRDMTFDPPSMKELAARAVKLHHLPYSPSIIPRTVFNYLDSAHHCVNPKCKGVYFDSRVEHVKFVDFCGKFRVPLLQYLCSPRCETSPAYAISTESESEPDNDAEVPLGKLRKVLLG